MENSREESIIRLEGLGKQFQTANGTVTDKTAIPGQLSFEERMGCGFGACMGCTCHTLVGPKRVCADGPVFLSAEVTFDE